MLERIISCGNKTHQEIFALSVGAAVTNHVDGVGWLKQQKFTPEIIVLAKSVPGEGLLSGLLTAVFSLSPQVEGGGG